MALEATVTSITPTHVPPVTQPDLSAHDGASQIARKDGEAQRLTSTAFSATVSNIKGLLWRPSC